MSEVGPVKYFLIACAVVAMLAGCAGDDNGARGGAGTTGDISGPPVLPAARYVERADELCRQLIADYADLRAQERLREIDQSRVAESEKLARFADVLAEQLAVVSAFRQRIEALGLPSEHRDDAQQLLEKARSAENALDQAVEAFRESNVNEANEALQRYFGFSQQSASIARDSQLNFAICGAGA